MPYVTVSGHVVKHEPALHVPVRWISWSEMATDLGMELSFDPPTREGDFLHDAQRLELERVLRAYNNAVERMAAETGSGT